jgi:hypothetical protein
MKIRSFGATGFRDNRNHSELRGIGYHHKNRKPSPYGETASKGVEGNMVFSKSGGEIETVKARSNSRQRLEQEDYLYSESRKDKRLREERKRRKALEETRTS